MLELIDGHVGDKYRARFIRDAVEKEIKRLGLG
jgi:hypothetical protein